MNEATGEHQELSINALLRRYSTAVMQVELCEDERNKAFANGEASAYASLLLAAGVPQERLSQEWERGYELAQKCRQSVS